MARFYLPSVSRLAPRRHGREGDRRRLVAVFGIPAGDGSASRARAASDADAVAAMGEIRPGSASIPVTCWPRAPRGGLVVGDAVSIAARLGQTPRARHGAMGEPTGALVAHAAPVPVGTAGGEGKSEPLAPGCSRRRPAAPDHRRRLDLPWSARATSSGVCSGRTAQLRRPPRAMLGQPGIGGCLVAERSTPGSHAGRALPGNRVSLAPGAAGQNRPSSHPDRRFTEAGGGHSCRASSRLSHRLRPTPTAPEPSTCRGRRRGWWVRWQTQAWS